MKCPIQRTEIIFSHLIYGPLKSDGSFSSLGPDNCQCHIRIRVIRQKGFINHYLKKRKSSKVKNKKKERKAAGRTNRISFLFSMTAIFEFRTLITACYNHVAEKKCFTKSHSLFALDTELLGIS